MPFYASDGKIGIDLDTVGSNCNYTPGMTVEGSNASEWVYVLATEALTQGAFVGVAASGRAQAITGGRVGTASATPSLKFGFAQTAFQASQWGFVAARGQGVLIRLLGGVGPSSAPLFTTDTVGALSTASASASQFQIFGVFTESSVSASAATAAAATANVSFPIIRKPGLGGG